MILGDFMTIMEDLPVCTEGVFNLKKALKMISNQLKFQSQS